MSNEREIIKIVCSKNYECQDRPFFEESCHREGCLSQMTTDEFNDFLKEILGGDSMENFDVESDFVVGERYNLKYLVENNEIRYIENAEVWKERSSYILVNWDDMRFEIDTEDILDVEKVSK